MSGCRKCACRYCQAAPGGACDREAQLIGDRRGAAGYLSVFLVDIGSLTGSNPKHVREPVKGWFRKRWSYASTGAGAAVGYGAGVTGRRNLTKSMVRYTNWQD